MGTGETASKRFNKSPTAELLSVLPKESVNGGEHLLQLITDSLPVLIAYVDAAERFQFSNKAHQKAWGLRREQIEGRLMRDVLSDPVYEKVRPLIQRALKGETITFDQEVEYRSLGKRFVDVRYIPHWEDESVHGFFVLVNDLTEKWQVEQERGEILKRYESLYKNTPVMLHSIDREGKLISVSNFWLENLGYTRDEVIGRPSTDFLTPESARYAREVILPAFYVDGVLKDIEYQFRKKDGTLVDVLLSATAERGADGRVERSLAVLIDVTARKESERKRFELEEQLRQSQKLEALGTLAGGIAHDFNNILGRIIGYTELGLGACAQNPTMQRYLRRTLTSAMRAKELIRQILTFTQHDTPGREIVDTRDILNEVVSLIRATIPSSVRIKTEFIDQPATVFANPTQLHQVILNMCTNAEYAMRGKGGTLSLSVGRVMIDSKFARHNKALEPGPHIRVAISDTGKGMTQEVLERMFEPYYTTKGVGEGTGLGLSVAHGIIASHKGFISVSSRVDEGSTFEIFLPHVLGLEKHQEAKSEVHAPGRGSILFVDDEKMLAELGGEMLRSLGYEVLTYSSSLEALRLIQSPEGTEFDLVITDQTMPDMTGDAFITEIHKLYPALPVILTTGYSAKVDRNFAKKLNVAGFLSKPYSIEDLSRVVHAVLDAAETRRE